MAALREQPERTYLTQRFARLDFGTLSVVGYSVAGEETVVQVPELGLCFDAGRAPQFALTSDILCLSHAHMDHVAGIAYYASQRFFQGMKPPVVLLPHEIRDAVADVLNAFGRLERQETPYQLVPMRPGEMHNVRNDFGIRCHRTHHGGPSLAFSAVQIRRKLKPEFLEKSGDEIVRLKKDGVEIQYTREVPLITFTGDTGDGTVWDEPDLYDAQVLLTECTFFEDEHRRKAKAGRHLHVETFADILPSLNCEHVVILHVSRRTGVQRAKKILRDLIGDDEMRRVHFLMDLKDARRAGDAAKASEGGSVAG